MPVSDQMISRQYNRSSKLCDLYFVFVYKPWPFFFANERNFCSYSKSARLAFANIYIYTAGIRRFDNTSQLAALSSYVARTCEGSIHYESWVQGPLRIAMVFNLRVLAVAFAALRIPFLTKPSAAVSVQLDRNEGPLGRPTLPSFLQGQPEERQVKELNVCSSKQEDQPMKDTAAAAVHALHTWTEVRGFRLSTQQLIRCCIDYLVYCRLCCPSQVSVALAFVHYCPHPLSLGFLVIDWCAQHRRYEYRTVSRGVLRTSCIFLTWQFKRRNQERTYSDTRNV